MAKRVEKNLNPVDAISLIRLDLDRLRQRQSLGSNNLQAEFDSAVPYTDALKEYISGFPPGYEARITETQYYIRHEPCGLILNIDMGLASSVHILNVLTRHTQNCPVVQQSGQQPK